MSNYDAAPPDVGGGSGSAAAVAAATGTVGNSHGYAPEQQQQYGAAYGVAPSGGGGGAHAPPPGPAGAPGGYQGADQGYPAADYAQYQQQQQAPSGGGQYASVQQGGRQPAYDMQAAGHGHQYQQQQQQQGYGQHQYQQPQHHHQQGGYPPSPHAPQQQYGGYQQQQHQHQQQQQQQQQYQQGYGQQQQPQHQHHQDQHQRRDSRSQQPEEATSNTVFVGNMEPEVGEAELREFFAQCGEVVSVRDCRETGKQFAFVEFDSVDAASRALQLHETPARTRRLRVRPAKGSSGGNRGGGGGGGGGSYGGGGGGGGGYGGDGGGGGGGGGHSGHTAPPGGASVPSTGPVVPVRDRGNRVLYVSGLTADVTEDALQRLFNSRAPVKMVVMMGDTRQKYRFALVEMVDFEGVQKGLGLHETMVAQDQIVVNVCAEVPVLDKGRGSTVSGAGGSLTQINDGLFLMSPGYGIKVNNVDCSLPEQQVLDEIMSAAGPYRHYKFVRPANASVGFMLVELQSTAQVEQAVRNLAGKQIGHDKVFCTHARDGRDFGQVSSMRDFMTVLSDVTDRWLQMEDAAVASGTDESLPFKDVKVAEMVREGIRVRQARGSAGGAGTSSSTSSAPRPSRDDYSGGGDGGRYGSRDDGGGDRRGQYGGYQERDDGDRRRYDGAGGGGGGARGYGGHDRDSRGGGSSGGRSDTGGGGSSYR